MARARQIPGTLQFNPGQGLGSIPGVMRLGQGTPGGLSNLPEGLPLPGGGITSGPPPVQFPSIRPSTTIPGTVQTPTSVASSQVDVAAQQRERTARLNRAHDILMQVAAGQLYPDQAKQQLSSIIGSDQQLWDTIQSQVSQVLSNKDTARGGELQMNALPPAPAPDQSQFHTAHSDKGGFFNTINNLGAGIGGMISGMPAGIGHMGVDIAKDLGSITTGQIPTHVLRGEIEPVAKGYAAQYGPAFHGNFHPLQQNPLGPILDALALVSAGVGTVGRIGEVSKALQAARAAAAERGVPDLAPSVGEGVQPFTEPAPGAIPPEPAAEAPPGVEPVRDPASLKAVFGRLDDRGYTMEHRDVGEYPDDHQDLFNETRKWGNKDAADIADELAITGADPDRKLAILRDAKGQAQAIGDYTTKDGVLDVGSLGANEPGAGAAWLRQLIRDHPNMDVHFMTGDPRNQAYYRAMGATPDPADPARFTMPAQKALEMAHPIEPHTGLSTVQLDKAGISPGELVKAGIKGFMRSGPKGNLIDRYEQATGVQHTAEIDHMVDGLAEVLGNTNLQVGRRSAGEVIQQIKADLQATRAAGKAKPAELAAKSPGFISSRTTGRALGAMGTTLREASDLVRAGAIYLRPAYLPNNWAGNGFMTATHQGFLAPVNIGKSFLIDKQLGDRYGAVIDKSLGTTPVEALSQEGAKGAATGYVAAITRPLAHVMGKIADQPFRRAAWLHEARRAGYRTWDDIKQLLDTASRHETSDEGVAALRQVADIGRRAQEEIVKFGDMNAAEREYVRHVFFVYSWLKGATRYAVRYPLQHPIQSTVYNRLAQNVGTPYINREMGGVPSFLYGSVPVGKDKNGNPILINPFALNPLGTGMQVGQALAGTLQVLTHNKSFNKYAQQDVTSLLNPIPGSYLQAREGGQSVKTQLQNTIAVSNLYKGLRHPGSGSIYPTTREEALGHFALGSLYPRVASQQAITKAVERENVANPAAMIPDQIKRWEKAYGQKMPPEIVNGYRNDLQQLKQQKDFKDSYAASHGQSGFRNLPASNQADAALQYLTQNHGLSQEDLDQFKQVIASAKTDAEMKSIANALWSATGVGSYKSTWDQMMSDLRGQQLTRKR